MRDIWISSDTHLGHDNILSFVDKNGNRIRPFDDVKQMNEMILERHNSRVKPGDIWYHLGDVFFGSKEEFQKIWPKFHGKKRLIVGNHDDIKFLSSGGFFQKVLMWRKMPDKGLIMSHVPLHYNQLFNAKTHSKLINVHGHVHNNTILNMSGQPYEGYLNVSMEAIDYTPIHIDEVTTRAWE